MFASDDGTQSYTSIRAFSDLFFQQDLAVFGGLKLPRGAGKKEDDLITRTREKISPLSEKTPVVPFFWGTMQRGRRNLEMLEQLEANRSVCTVALSVPLNIYRITSCEGRA